MITTQLHTQLVVKKLNFTLELLLFHKINIIHNYLRTLCVQGLIRFYQLSNEQQDCVDEQDMITFQSELLDLFKGQYVEEDKEYFDTYQSSQDMNPQQNFFDSIDPTMSELFLNLIKPSHHIINVTKNQNGSGCHAAPAVSQQAGLELLISSEFQIKDGRKAFSELQARYKGDELTTETTEDVRSKLDKLGLSIRITGSEYINNFQLYTKQLDSLGKSYTTSKTVSIFLDQISDLDYTSTKELCIENQHNLDECIARIRAKERQLDREKLRHRIRSISVRRAAINEEDNNVDTDEFDLSEYLTDKGYYSIPLQIWKSLSNDDKEKIKQFNGLLRKKRRNSNNTEHINNRRTPHQEPETKKRKTVQFQD